MKLIFLFSIGFSLLLFACENKEKPVFQMKHASKPQIKHSGEEIIFSSMPPHFSTWQVGKRSLEGKVEAPAKVAATIYAGAEDSGSKVILFENSEITELYSNYLQSVAHENRDTEFFKRVEDMNKNGAATGKELLEARTGMLDAQNTKLEGETRLRVFGYKPSELKMAPPHTAWIVANVAEPDLKHIHVGASCDLEFNSFSDEIFTG